MYGIVIIYITLIPVSEHVFLGLWSFWFSLLIVVYFACIFSNNLFVFF